jgi:hypothetical protein
MNDLISNDAFASFQSCLGHPTGIRLDHRPPLASQMAQCEIVGVAMDGSG